MKQLQLQVEVLQKLRLSESRRRSETSVENIELKMAYQNSLEKVKRLENVSHLEHRLLLFRF